MPPYTGVMQHLRASTKAILAKVEEVSGRSVQFLRDDEMPLIASLQMARHGAAFHVLRYKPTNDPMDYLVAYQAGFLLRLFQNEPNQRFDFVPKSDAGKQVELLLTTGQALGDGDRKVLPDYSRFVAQWALMNLRSTPIGLRIDQWIAAEHPELREQQMASIAIQQQQNMGILSQRVGKLMVPTTLMGPVAAYALFADRLAGSKGFAIPFESAGFTRHGRELLDIWDQVPGGPESDCSLVDAWARKTGMANWYNWIPYQP